MAAPSTSADDGAGHFGVGSAGCNDDEYASDDTCSLSAPNTQECERLAAEAADWREQLADEGSASALGAGMSEGQCGST